MQPDDEQPMESPPLERKLAAILAADFEGYSRLMHANEERTLATLTAHRAVVDDLILAARGQIFGTAGDSVLAEFPSVVDAYSCAIAIQQALGRANSALPEDQRMLLRIGINVGDVMVKEGDIFGDGVNIAARVEALAEPGAVCVTRGVRDHLRDRVETAFEDLGEHSVKNIARPVRVFRAIFDPEAEPALPDLPPRQEGEVEGAKSGEDEKPTAAEPGSSAEIAFWQSVQASDDDAEYRIYLERYPEGAFADLARARLEGASSVEDPAVELTFWDTVRNSGNTEMIKAYLGKYPKGKFRSLGDILLQSLEEAR
jgi:adenylate cyclase